ncbi:MAG: hypothetical protein WC670_11495 [Pseudolabrys sp.]|jgi:hypothetical protein
MPDEEIDEVEHLRLDCDKTAALPQFAAFRIQHPILESITHGCPRLPAYKMKDFSKENQGALKARRERPAQIGLIADTGNPLRRLAMNRQDIEYRDRKNGMIDYDGYSAIAADMRREARSRILVTTWTALAAYFRFPQKRWIR